ncbi:hypothetical protein G5B37_03550 [Rasiella rasia]|uniref:Uncharacterized protein n=1 Tax=Rasiella rasia TaxID=2744027 RepID=A0A6G6GJG6_9FLAO|nr:hypothetical protein [Rasiella rasia]QIE58667.1 hypothetical protein G5B37_03550 [Rasiella rasia]
MKNTIKLIGFTLLIFIMVTLLTMKIETPFDGNDTYGFPFTFHIKWSGMCDPCPDNPTETYLGYLFIDIVLSGLFGFGILSLIRKLKRRND